MCCLKDWLVSSKCDSVLCSDNKVLLMTLMLGSLVWSRAQYDSTFFCARVTMGDHTQVSALSAWSHKAPVGGRLDSTPLSFTHDSKYVLFRDAFSSTRYIFAVCGSAIKLYSSTSGELVRVLRGHTRAVTGLAVNPANFLQLVSCSGDGTIRLWNYHEAQLIRVRFSISGSYVQEIYVPDLYFLGLAFAPKTGKLFVSAKQFKTLDTVIGEFDLE